jgi:type I restriction enzyme M protein
MYENAFNAIEKALRAEEGISNELDYVEQTSWVLFLKYLHDLESERRDRAELEGRDYVPIIDGRFRWDRWAAPKVNGQFDHNAAMTGDDLVRFVDQELFPHLALFHDRARGRIPSSTRSARCSPNCGPSSGRATSCATC